MGRFTTKNTGNTTNTTSLKHWLFVMAGTVKRARVISFARHLYARITGRVAVASVAVCADAMAARRHGRAMEQQTLALLHSRLGWRPATRGPGGSSGF
jgi:hypothetical protein